MEHSIAARFAARPAARFPRASAGSRRRRLGLQVVGAFRPASTRLTVLHHDQPSPVSRLHRDPRSIAATRPSRPSRGLVRPPVSPTWPRSLAPRHPSAPAAPWRA